MGIDIAGLFHPLIEAFQLGLQRLQIGIVFGMFPQQPQHAAVERSGPFKVFCFLGITQPFRVGSGEGVVEAAAELVNFGFAEVQLLQGKSGGQHIVALVHHVSSFQTSGGMPGKRFVPIFRFPKETTPRDAGSLPGRVPIRKTPGRTVRPH